MKKQILILLLLLLAGIFSAQLLGRGFFAEYGFLNEYHLRTFAAAKPDRMALFGSILWERGKLFLALAVLGLTPLKRVLPLMIEWILGFTIGFFGAACVMNLHAAGLGVLFLSLFPQGLFYLPVLFLLPAAGQPPVYREKGYAVRKTLAFAILIILLIAGCLTEATAGTFFMQAFLKKFIPA